MTVFTREQFRSVNGFSNRFFGWGGEDDEMMHRYVHITYLWNETFQEHIRKVKINILTYSEN